MGNNQHNSRLKDEILADLTDRILEVEEPKRLEILPDKELVKLQETVMFIKHVIGPRVDPSQATSRSIYSTIMKTWSEVWSKQETQRTRWRSASAVQKKYALRFALISILLLLTALILTPKLETALSGTAESMSPITPVVVIVILISSLAIWLVRNKRKGG